jgi:hypothetical protein
MRHHGILKPRSVWALRLSAVLAGLVSVYTHAMAQDGLAQNGSMLPAVSSLNASFSVEGGLYDNDEAFVALGSVTAPAGHNYGVQFDGAVGTIDGDAIIGGGFHAFRRNPESYLLGVFTSHHRWKEFEISRVAAESELYWNDLRFAPLSGSSTSPCRTGSGP